VVSSIGGLWGNRLSADRGRSDRGVDRLFLFSIIFCSGQISEKRQTSPGIGIAYRYQRKCSIKQDIYRIPCPPVKICLQQTTSEKRKNAYFLL